MTAWVNVLSHRSHTFGLRKLVYGRDQKPQQFLAEVRNHRVRCLSGQPEPLQSHEELCRHLQQLSGDPLESDGGRVVLYRGNPMARLMVVGEAPGRQEDEQGKPFVGEAGKLLDKILESVELNPEHDVYVTNVCKRKPLNNRKPTVDEIKYYTPFLEQEISLVNPSIIVVAGASAAQSVLEYKGSLGKIRGEWFDRDGRQVMPVWHPSYLLRNPDRRKGSVKWQMWEDIQEVRRVFNSLDE